MIKRRLLAITLVIALLAIALLAASGIGYQLGWWTLGSAFTTLRWAAYVGTAGALLAIIGMAVTRPIGRATALFGIALLVAALAVWLPWAWKQQAGQVPPIHDVTTDTEDPPLFVAVLPLRASAQNSATYAGDSIAAQQRAGYPDLGPVSLAEPPATAFVRARDAAAEMGWTMVDADSATGRIEATATTTWFGFKDDVVIRVRPSGTGSRIDVRSVSRIGGSDTGANAARIRRYIGRLKG